MLQCHGTSKEDAQNNQLLREAIAGNEGVKSTFGTFYLENGQGKVILDILKAFEHVRHVLNDIRRANKSTKVSDYPIISKFYLYDLDCTVHVHVCGKLCDVCCVGTCV